MSAAGRVVNAHKSSFDCALSLRIVETTPVCVLAPLGGYRSLDLHVPGCTNEHAQSQLLGQDRYADGALF